MKVQFFIPFVFFVRIIFITIPLLGKLMNFAGSFLTMCGEFLKKKGKTRIRSFCREQCQLSHHDVLSFWSVGFLTIRNKRNPQESICSPLFWTHYFFLEKRKKPVPICPLSHSLHQLTSSRTKTLLCLFL